MSTGSESTNSYTISNLTNEFAIYPSYGDYVNAAVLVFFFSIVVFCSHAHAYSYFYSYFWKYLSINFFSNSYKVVQSLGC